MVLALRTFKAEDEEIVKDFLEGMISQGEKGIAYAITNAKGDVVASGFVGDGIEDHDVGIARLRASVAIVFQKNTADIKTLVTGNILVDSIYSGGGILVIANSAVCGAIGIAGRPRPEKLFPGKALWDHELAFILGEHLKGKLNLEGNLE